MGGRTSCRAADRPVPWALMHSPPTAAPGAGAGTEEDVEPRLDDALARAVHLAGNGPLAGGNPRVGCVLVDAEGRTVGEGWHAGAGSVHAEVAALDDFARRHPGAPAVGMTAVVTLEPCNHSGRTGPCSHALLAAGVQRVIYAVTDPDPRAAGGASWLAERGVEVRTAGEAGIEPGVRARAEGLVHSWSAAVRRRRPWVIGKSATTLDGRVAAADRTSRWITGAAARAHAHEVRAEVDAIVTGTGTVLADDPALTSRTQDGAARAYQPLRVVLGTSDVPLTARLRTEPGPWLHLPTRDLATALDELYGRGVRRLLIEGGPTLLTAALGAGLVDEVHAYIAPVILGAGPGAVGDIGVQTITQAVRWQPYRTQVMGEDIFVAARRRRDGPGAVRVPSRQDHRPQEDRCGVLAATRHAGGES